MFFKNNININCDVGEGLGNEVQLMPYISSCNIACGGHAGSIEIIDQVLELAIKNKVLIGGHPSYPDRNNFGRKRMSISNKELQKSIEEQIKCIQSRVLLQEAKIHHIKPHGALYNIAAKEKDIANVLLDAIENTIEDIALYIPSNSVVSNMAQERGISVIPEAFVDRRYNDDLSLVSRGIKGAVITNKEQALEQLKNMVFNKKVISINGLEKPIQASTFCVHGDNENVIELLKFFYTELFLES